MADNRILLGVVGRPHGVRGLVRVVSYTADPAGLAAYGPLSDDVGRQFSLRWRGDGLADIAEVIDGRKVPVTDRNAAARLTNTRLYVGRDRLPALAPDEFYLADLVGLTAVDERAVPFGKVAAVHDYGAGASLEIERGEGGAPLLLPFTRACVPEIDAAAGRLVAIPPHETDHAEGAAA